jgi:predicted negative regulator of RcsB-dependent stress response
MLTPKKKITKKELKHDPLLDSLEKGKEFYEENSKQIVTGISVVIVVFLLGWGWMNNIQSTKNEAMLANTKTTIAAIQGVNSNVFAELEQIIDEYGSNDEVAQSALLLGTAKMDSGDFIGAEELFSTLANSSDKQLKVAGKLKLAYLAEKQADHAAAAALYQTVANLDEGWVSDNARLQAGYAYLAAGDATQARNIVTSMLDEEPTGNLKEQLEYLSGKLLET